jgi:hypothetical protein
VTAALSQAPRFERARAPLVHRLAMHRGTKSPRESGAAIRAKSRFWRAAMRREAVDHENFFIAKNRDSESAQRAFSRPRSVATTSAVRRSFNESMTKMPAAQSLLAILTVGVVGFHAHLASLRECIMVLSMNARSKSALGHVNTSLSRTLFFSMCWCIRDAVHSIPGCTQRLSHLTTLGGQHGQES